MQREIKALDQLKVQADYERLGRVERIIIEALIKNETDIFVPDYLCNDFVKEKLYKSGYKLKKQYVDKFSIIFE